MDGTGELFAPFLAALPPTWSPRVISYPRQTVLTLGAITQAVTAELARLAGEPFLLLGESFSGPVALRIAAEQPTGMQGLILCASFHRHPRPPLAALTPYLGHLPPGRLPEWLLQGALGRVPEISPVAPLLQTVSGPVWRQRFRDLAREDASGAARQLGASSRALPVLYLQGRHDRLVPPTAALALQALIPHMQRIVLPGPHLLLQACPREAVAAITGWWDRVAHRVGHRTEHPGAPGLTA